ncbi:MAG: 4-demethylwyosine synthase TYW1 [Nanoarchaeota archaeon]|nr:4-demethylwyosine synthase TYW1 [Nanoarchaeota archaeon]MBU4241972.1 4-demethylwyosine synthase TYW1 [Nanoarchaeota archaeon]MBU4351572.1 4-demethylwyosine synthase TYW1 [Nanoarchaeota archaeon]MCG2720351.1 4-demethylwyosine synthase TYW1 [Nanoarchaeota archaeon]
MKNKQIQDLEKQGYRIVGKHSAIKVCLWCKRSLCGEDVCYKNTFYGIQSHRCIQSSVSLFNCLHNCQFCWRCLEYTDAKVIENPDEPKIILDGLIKEHKEFLQGFKGNDKVTNKLFNESMEPKHIALSLAGDATMYPKLPELIDLIHERKMTSFLVTNGLMPDMLEKLLQHQPTQLYITLAAPDKETYLKVCRPLVKDGWERLQKALQLLKKFQRSTIRLTLVKYLNMHNAKGYAEEVSKVQPMFVELKAGMPVGYAQYRMIYENMPRHEEIKEFAKEIAKLTNYKIVDEKENSRVVLLMKEDKYRKLNFN